MLPGRKYTLDEIIRILRRRWAFVLLPVVLGTAAGILAFMRLPPLYESETVIVVIPQRLPDSYVKPTVTSSVDERLRSVSEQIQSRTRLAAIIRDFDLYKEERARGLTDDVIQRMRGDIRVKFEGNELSFGVSYSHPDRTVAQKVTERLAALYIAENLRDREGLADGTSKFLETQLQDARQRLIAQEKKLEEYRRRYAGQLPSQLQGNLQTIQNAQLQLQSLAESMNRARERRLLIERQIVDLQSYPPDPVSVPTTAASPEGGAPGTTAQQLEAARARLAQLNLRYTRDYPDVVAAEQAIRDLQARAADEAKQPRQASPETALSASEVARRKRLKDLQGEQNIIDHQLAAAQAEEASLKRKMAEHQAKIDVVPTRESELVELTRDYGTLQETYSSLLQKREDSKLAANLERRQIAEQFRILDPASLPERPRNQKHRLAVLFAGPAGGLALGLLLVGFLEYRDSSFKSEDDVLRVLSLPVLALIPVMDEKPSRGHGPSLAGLTVVLVIMSSAAALVFWKLQT